MYVVSECFIVTAADIEARTLKDQQTPLHFAAKNDAVGGVRMLLQNGADIAVRDYKERTPLQLAANFGKAFISSSRDRPNACPQALTVDKSEDGSRRSLFCYDFCIQGYDERYCYAQIGVRRHVCCWGLEQMLECRTLMDSSALLP